MIGANYCQFFLFIAKNLCIFASSNNFKMYDTLHIEELYNALGNSIQLSSYDIADFYHTYSPNMPISTIRWKIHSLVDKGIIYPVGRGLYQFGRKNINIIS